MIDAGCVKKALQGGRRDFRGWSCGGARGVARFSGNFLVIGKGYRATRFLHHLRGEVQKHSVLAS